jgi:hypothetical protein
MHFFNVLEKKCCRYRTAAAMNFKKPAAAAPPWASLIHTWINYFYHQKN